MKACFLFLAPCVLVLVADSSPPQKPTFWSSASITELNGNIVLRANDPRPLDQALNAIRQEYGWKVDYEDPAYEFYELADDTDPKWRQTHPGAKGVTRVAGGLFTTTFDTAPDMSSGSPQEQRVLDKVVTDYNQSENPGKFVLKTEGDNRFSVVGVASKRKSGNEESISPVLDSRISLPVQERTVSETIQLILQAVSEQNRYRVVLGAVPLNLVLQTRISTGGQNVAARQLLAELASRTRLPLIWRLLYDADPHCYFMNFEVASKPLELHTRTSR